MKKLFRSLGLWGGMAILLASCHTVPETGRSAFNIIPASEEIALGEEAFTAMKAEMADKIVTSGREWEMLQRVGSRIAQVAPVAGAQWEFVLFDDEAVNAFALPGGKVGVYTGLFRAAETEDELAVVVGHEIAHVVARHGVSRMSTNLAIALGGVALGVANSNASAESQALVLAAYGVTTNLAVALPYSRSNETEADHIGLIYAARAGYDPRVAIQFWQKMERESGGSSVPEWISTHPASHTRIEQMRALMPRAMQEYQKAHATH